MFRNPESWALAIKIAQNYPYSADQLYIFTLMTLNEELIRLALTAGLAFGYQRIFMGQRYTGLDHSHMLLRMMLNEGIKSSDDIQDKFRQAATNP